MMQSSDTITWSASGGTLTGVSIIPDEYRVRDDIAYTIAFTTANDIPLGARIQIELPPTMSFNKTNFTGFED